MRKSFKIKSVKIPTVASGPPLTLPTKSSMELVACKMDLVRRLLEEETLSSVSMLFRALDTTKDGRLSLDDFAEVIHEGIIDQRNSSLDQKRHFIIYQGLLLFSCLRKQLNYPI